MKLRPREFDLLVLMHNSSYSYPLRSSKQSEWRWLDSLVAKEFAERNPAATMPRAYRITDAGTARLLNPIELLEAA